MTDLLRTAHTRGDLGGAAPLLAAAAAYRPAFTDPAELPAPPAAVLLSDGPPDPAVVCVPSFLAGFGPHTFARFAAAFERRPRTCALVLPGFGTGTGTGACVGIGTGTLPASRRAAVDALAAGALAAAGDEGAPLLLAGHASGGVLAHAVGVALRAAGHQVAGVVLIDTYEPEPARHAEVFAWAMGHVLRRGPAHPDINDDTILAMGGYLRLLDGWPAAPPERLDAPTLLVTAEHGPDAPGAGEWRRWRAADTVVRVPGDHGSLLGENAAHTARAVEDWLRTGTGRGART
ncbi:thioesterase domain-containing protein [Streptomyces sp. 4N509B]|uniref:thioesterase domain-containing protein n=1 Tax=Streptomyces sp. 4N509B TaxID=3457413 RepID=UPI003FCFDD9A